MPDIPKFLMKTYKALVLQGALPTLRMRPVTGPLQTDTYIQELRDAPGRYTTLIRNQPKFVLTNDPQSAKVRTLKDM